MIMYGTIVDSVNLIISFQEASFKNINAHESDVSHARVWLFVRGLFTVSAVFFL